jgi:tRNA threonylcarbamoyladenosine biosynthesis protein TsaB
MTKPPAPLPSWLLALDGATDQLSLALVAPSGEQITRELPGGAMASVGLVPAVMRLLAEAGIGPGQLGCIGFGQGPGAFTGLRSVCAVTQGLALGWQLPVRPLDSLLIVAEDAWTQQADAPASWGAVIDARMGELYAARYLRRAEGGWTCIEVPGLWRPDALRAHWQDAEQPSAVAGNGLALLAFDGEVQVAASHSRAAALGRLVHQAALRGDALLDAALALPVYVRDKVALTMAERTQAMAAPA